MRFFSPLGPRHAQGPRAASAIVPQRGFTLIELLVSLAIGLLIMAAASSIFVRSGRTSRVAEISTKLNEDGALALNIIQQQLRMGGYSQRVVVNNANVGVANFEGAAVRGCSGGFAGGAAGYQTAFNALTCASGVNGATATNDAIAVRYEADQNNTVPTSAGLATNCLGQGITADSPSAVAGAAAYALADNRFFLNNGSFSCAGATSANTFGTAQPLFDNVEQLVLRYGVAAQPVLTTAQTFSADLHQITNYLTAAQVDALGADVNGNWGRVRSVRSCVLVRSSQELNDETPPNYTDCLGNVVAPRDHFLRRAFVTTTMLRNRVTVPKCVGNDTTAAGCTQ